MSRLNPLAGLDSYVTEVRSGFSALLRTLVAVGDLLAQNATDEGTERWDEHVRRLESEGHL